MKLELSTTMNGLPLSGSPFAIEVIAGDAAAIRCTLEGDGLLGAVVRRGGARRQLTLTTADVHGNACGGGGAVVSISLMKNDASPLSRPSSRPASARPSAESTTAGGASPAGLVQPLPNGERPAPSTYASTAPWRAQTVET